MPHNIETLEEETAEFEEMNQQIHFFYDLDNI
jgi:hypothetical protein